MRVLLVQHSGENTDAYPLGLGYVAAVLGQAGHTVSFLDLALVPEKDRAGKLVRAAHDMNAQALGFTVQTPQYSEYLGLMRQARPHLSGIQVVMGGAHPSAIPETVLREGAADIVVITEGEITAVDLFDALDKNGDIGTVPGIAFIDSGENFVRTAPGKQVSDLDAVPFPPWDMFQPGTYKGRIRGRRKANIITSRGCPHRCVHCFRGPTGGPRHRKRSVRGLLKEVSALRREHGISSFRFVDDIFTLDMDRARELCDALIAEERDVIWNCQTGVASVDRDLIRKMKQAGCVGIDFGIESGSDHVREKLRKRISREQVRQAVSYCHELGVPFTAFFMIGTPWETPGTVEETISFAKELRATVTMFFLATPYPGTELRKEFLKYGWPVPDDYSEYRHFIEARAFASGTGDGPPNDKRAFYAAECGRATREIFLSQVSDIRHYPELIRAFFRRYSAGELAEKTLKRLRRVL